MQSPIQQNKQGNRKNSWGGWGLNMTGKWEEVGQNLKKGWGVGNIGGVFLKMLQDFKK